VFVLALAVDCGVIMRWQMASLASSKQKIAKVKAEVDSISRDMALMNLNGGEAKAVKMFSENRIPELLKYISSVATSHNMKINQITPLKSKSPQAYMNLAVKVDLLGGYHEFGAFLNELERGEHPLFAEDFRIAQSGDPLRQSISLNLKTYVKK
jgi:type IV pilus assembly protein PilO